MSDLLTPEEFLTLAALIERLLESAPSMDTLLIRHEQRWSVILAATANDKPYLGAGDTLLTALMRAFWPDL